MLKSVTNLLCSSGWNWILETSLGGLSGSQDIFCISREISLDSMERPGATIRTIIEDSRDFNGHGIPAQHLYFTPM
jgi:hypothetical protein